MRSGTFYDQDKELEREEKEEQKRIKKRRKIVRSAAEPILPQVVILLYWAMLVLLPVAMITEIIVTVEGKSTAGINLFLSRSATSLGEVWLGLGVPVLILSCIQLLRYYYKDYREMTYKFPDEISDREIKDYKRVSNEGTETEMILYAKEEQPTNRKYFRYIRTTLITGGIVLLYYIVTLIIRS